MTAAPADHAFAHAPSALRLRDHRAERGIARGAA
jgi:hypothetical protein